MVAVRGADAWESLGVPDDLRFGLSVGEGQVILRRSEALDLDNPHRPLRYDIVQLPLGDFCPPGYRLYTYSVPETVGTPHQIAARARFRLWESGKAHISPPGDDFVYECLSTRTLFRYLEEHPEVGAHLWTPLRYSAADILQTLGIPLPFSPQDWALLRDMNLSLEHHGIRMEGDRVLHFARRADDCRNRLRADSLADFLATVPDAPDGGSVPYAGQGAAERLCARNAALGTLLRHDQWGEYNVLDNNCEHFCAYCHTGKRRSQQVERVKQEALAQVVPLLATIALPGGGVLRAVKLILPLITPVLTHYMMNNTPNKLTTT